MRKSNKKNSKSRPVEGRTQMVPKPPQIQTEVRQTRKLRFTNTGSNPATSVTWYNLLDTVLIAGTATNSYQLYDFVRVKEIEMWGKNSSGTAVSIGVDFGGVVAGNLGPGRSFEDTSLSNSYPAYLKVRPDPKSQVAQFQVASSAYAFHVRATGATAETLIVDVTLEFTNSPVVQPNAVAQAVAGATPGMIYFGGLDGLRAASTAWRSLLVPDVI